MMKIVRNRIIKRREGGGQPQAGTEKALRMRVCELRFEEEK